MVISQSVLPRAWVRPELSVYVGSLRSLLYRQETGGPILAEAL